MKRDGSITAFAPASIGNVGVGFDMLGLALKEVGDRVAARKTDQDGVSIAEVRGRDGRIHPYLSADAQSNTASIAARALWEAHGNGGGIELVVHKGVPLQSGMGSSAASAVAAVVAVNALLDRPLQQRDLLQYAMEGEMFASGDRHTDNVAPSLLGGLVLCPLVLLPNVVQLDVPDGVSSVLVHPELKISTSQSRKKLARAYSIEQWLAQQGYLAGFIAGCQQQDRALMRDCLRDVIIEPQRKDSIACFDAVKNSALQANAYGCSISGSGPSIFALCTDADAANIAVRMEQACRNAGLDCQSWISPLGAPGAHVESDA